MREKLLKSLRYTLEDAENWLDVAKNENDENWIDHMGQYLYNLGRVYQTALILQADYKENGKEVHAARNMRHNMYNDIATIQEIHQEEKRTCAPY